MNDDVELPQLPDITWQSVAIGLGILATAILLAWLFRLGGRAWLTRRGRGPSYARVMPSIASWLIVLLGFAISVTVIFPSVKPVNVLGGVGVISLAAGIAFQTVLGNLFAGMVILVRDKFRDGDQIQVEDMRGTITSISLSATSVRTFDGRLVLVPNQRLHSEQVVVQTGFEKVRTSVDILLDADADVDGAREAALRAMANLPPVYDDPKPQALLIDIGTGSVTMQLRFWSGARQLETVAARDAVIGAVLRELAAAGVRLGIEAQLIEPGSWLRDWLESRPRPADDTSRPDVRDDADRERRG